MSYIVYDIIVLLVLLLFAFWGMHRGLVRTLCSLVAVLIAFGGASFAAKLLAPPVAGLLEPPITSAIEERLEEAIENAAFTSPEWNGALSADQIPLSGVLEILEDAGLHGTLIDSIRTAVEEGASGAASNAAAQVGAAAARSLSYLLAYLVSFVLILILWHIVSRVLNLAARLPGLRTLNKAGGFVLGALRGVIVLFVCVWLLRWLGKSLLPPDAAEQTYVLRFFMVSNPLNLIGLI